MGRRSDHTRAELEALIITTGHDHLASVGFRLFSAREVAKRIGYSIGTIYNVFGSYDRLILAINGRTLDQWAEFIGQELAQSSNNTLHALVRSYFRFAEANPHTWAALYDHRLPPDEPMPEWYRAKLARLFAFIETELVTVLGQRSQKTDELARQLYAAVHGFCALRLNGTLATLGVENAETLAISLVDRQISAAAASSDSKARPVK